MMPQPLKFPQLVDQHGMPQVQIGRGRIKARLDAQRRPRRQFFFEFSQRQDFITAPADAHKRVTDLFHHSGIALKKPHSLTQRLPARRVIGALTSLHARVMVARIRQSS